MDALTYHNCHLMILDSYVLLCHMMRPIFSIDVLILFLFCNLMIYIILFSFTGTGITTYSVHPGIVRSEMGRDMYYKKIYVLDFLWRLLSWPFFKDCVHGVQTQICCAISEEFANQSGKYYRYF